MTEPSPPADIHVRREGRCGRITLDRPKVLNALTYPQVGVIQRALDGWRDDATVEIVLLDAIGERAFCAGGDIRSLYDAGDQGPALARAFWRDEYRLNSAIFRYQKPIVALMDGIVMGGGIGLSAHASHRVVTERSQLAMPETTIGLIPDVGGTWLLANAPGETGLYLGLTGARMTAADAIYARFADAFVPSDRLPDLVRRLVAPGPSAGEIVRTLATEPPAPELAARRAELDAIYGAPTVEAIVDRLSALSSDAARKDEAAFASRSPKALKLALAAIRGARRLANLEEALVQEYRLTVRLFDDGEFLEGVRALIVDKDRAPKWHPATLAAVPADLVERYLAPLPDGGDLTF